MGIYDFVGKNSIVTLYLEGGHILKNAKVIGTTSLKTIENDGRSIQHEALALRFNGHSTIVRFDKIVAIECYNN